MSDKSVLPRGHRLQGGNRVYTIEEHLGQGGFGITYRAKAPIMVGSIRVLGDFALKEFFLRDDCERLADSSISYSNPARDRVENSLKDFLNEAKRLNKIGFSHPNIVGFDEVFECNNTAYYVMEYLQGESLDDYVEKRGVLSEEETIQLMQPILDAVKMLHDAHICHLDLKPGNIMLTRNDAGELRPVLIDFGLSKHYDNEGHATSTINTFGYSEGFAPAEQYRGITTFSPGADIYALGATIYFCLTGKIPPSALDLRDGELAGMLPQNVSEYLRERVELMTRDKRTRPTDLGEILPLKVGEKPQAVREEPKKDVSRKTEILTPAKAHKAATAPKLVETAGRNLPEEGGKPQPMKNATEVLQPKKGLSSTVKYAIIGFVVVALAAVGILAVVNNNESESQTEVSSAPIEPSPDAQKEEIIIGDDATPASATTDVKTEVAKEETSKAKPAKHEQAAKPRTEAKKPNATKTTSDKPEKSQNRPRQVEDF